MEDTKSSYSSGMRNMLRYAIKKCDYTEDASILSKGADTIRRDIFSHTGFKFTGLFTAGFQENSVPVSLKPLVSMIVNGIQ